jgi:hypothetical protein
MLPVFWIRTVIVVGIICPGVICNTLPYLTVFAQIIDLSGARAMRESKSINIVRVMTPTY